MIGIAIGWAIKPLALRDDEPMRRNSPTVDQLVVRDDRNLAAEKERLSASIDRFAASGPKSCTTHPHSFFGRLPSASVGSPLYAREGYTEIMSIGQRLSNLGIDPDLPDEEIKRKIAALAEKHAEEQAEALKAHNLTLPSSEPS